MKWAILCVCALVLASCGGGEAPPPATAVPETTPEVAEAGTCLVFEVDNPDVVTCVESGEERAVVQTQSDTEASLSNDNLSLILNGTSTIETANDTITITTLEGSSTINANGETQILEAGSRLALAFVDGVLQLSDDNTVETVDVETIELPELLSLNPDDSDSGDVLTRPDATEIPLEDIDDDTDEAEVFDLGDGCESSWRNVYVVKYGDVLETIARNYGTTVAEMTEANCLLNPSELDIDQVLRVPRPIPITPTPFFQSFYADSREVPRDVCTRLRWDVRNVDAVYLDDVQVELQGREDICPDDDTTYTLRVEYPDGTSTTHTVTVTVSGQ